MISKKAKKRKSLIFGLMGLLIFINPAKITFFQLKFLRYAIFIASFRRPKIKYVSWFRTSLNNISLFIIRPKNIWDKKTIIFFGIGGSYLAPNLLNEVFGSLDKEIIFVTGSDPDEYKDLESNTLKDAAFILASKSFSTTETLTSYESVTKREFLLDTYAITSNIDGAKNLIQTMIFAILELVLLVKSLRSSIKKVFITNLNRPLVG